MDRAFNAWHIVWRPLIGATHDRTRVEATRDYVDEEAYSHLSYTVRHGVHTLHEGGSRVRGAVLGEEHVAPVSSGPSVRSHGHRGGHGGDYAVANRRDG